VRAFPHPPSDDILKAQIATVLANSNLTIAEFVDAPTSVAKQSLMKRWDEDALLSTLELQRVLQIMQEIGDGK
jgi:hypothetical protein